MFQMRCQHLGWDQHWFWFFHSDITLGLLVQLLWRWERVIVRLGQFLLVTAVLDYCSETICTFDKSIRILKNVLPDTISEISRSSALPSLQDVYTSHCRTRTTTISKGPSHRNYCLFCLLNLFIRVNKHFCARMTCMNTVTQLRLHSGNSGSSFCG